MADFLIVNDTLGLNLINVLISTIKDLKLNINKVRGQTYNSGSNIKDEQQGV